MVENTENEVVGNGKKGGRKRGSIVFSWTGVFLMIVGLAFLLRNTGLMSGTFNWWAFFILLPAMVLLAFATAVFQKHKKFNIGVRLMGEFGLITLTVAAMFILNLDWSTWWPLMLLVPGAMMMLNGFSNTWQNGIMLDRLIALFFWVGFSVMFLGLGFLVEELGLVNIQALFGNFSWWGVFILLPGLGSILSAYLNYRKMEKQASAENILLLTFGLICCVPGLVAVTGLPWDLLTPIYLIVIGFLMLLKYQLDVRKERV